MSRTKTFFGRRRQELFAELNCQRQTGEFLDLVVRVQDIRFRCHRAILSSTPSFKAILSQIHAKGKSSKVIKLRIQNIDPLCFAKILDFVYTGEITISKDDVNDILQAAHLLSGNVLDNISIYCRDFMHNTLCPSNCLLFMHFANMYGFSTLKREARRKAIAHFSKAKQDDGFLTLSSDELVNLLQDDLLQVTSEDEIATSVIRWLNHDPESRKLALPMILKEIHLSCVRVSVLRELESHLAVQESAECLTNITAAKEEHLNGTRQLTTGAHKRGCCCCTPIRKPATTDDLIIIGGGWKVDKLILPLQSIIGLDPDDRHFYHITDLPTPDLVDTSVVNTGRRLYVSGGCIDDDPDSAPIKQIFCYDFATDTWEKLPDMPRGRAEHQSVVVDGKLFLVGGDVKAASDEAASADTTCPLTIDCYDLEKGTWIEPPTAPLIDPLSNTKVAAACRGKLVLIEGLIKTSRRTLRVHALDLLNGEWVYSDIAWKGYESDSHWLDVDISVNAIDDKLYFRAESNLFAYDVKSESLTKVKITAVPSGIKFLYTKLDADCLVDACITSIHEFADRYRQKVERLPFAVTECTVLGTKKSSIGWYCRDHLVKLNRNNINNDQNDKEGRDDDHEDETHSKMRPPTAHFQNPSHSDDLSVELARQCNTGTYTDVVLEVEGQKVCCHRAVLVSTPYFKAMFSSSFKESNSRVVKLCGINFNSLVKILTFLYKGSIQISGDNVQDILQAAHMLQIDEITEFCRTVIQDNIHACNCIGVMRLANLYGFSDLEKKAELQAVTHFSEVRQNEEFLSLSTVELVKLLGGRFNRLLEVTSEDEVVTCVLRWLDHDPESRKTAIPAILQEIRLPYVKVSTLEKLESHPGVLESAECLNKITAVKEGHLAGTRRLHKYGRKRSRKPDNLEILFGGLRWIGLYQPSIPLESIVCRDPNSQQYFYITKLPTSVACVSVARAERHLYVTGGYGPQSQSNDRSASRLAFRYNFLADTWTKLPDMPRGRAEHQSIVVEGKLYVVGGDDKATSVSMDCYDLEEETWIQLVSLPEIDPWSQLRLVDTSSNHVVLFEISCDSKKCVTNDVLRRVLGGYFDAKWTNLVVHVLKVATDPLSNDGDDDSDDSDEDEWNDNDGVWDEKEEDSECDENEQWTRSDILVLHNVDGCDVFVITVNDRVYFHFVCTRLSLFIGRKYIQTVYVYNVKENTVIDAERVCDINHTECDFRRYYNAFGRFKDAVINRYMFQNMASGEGETSTYLLSKSVLIADKRSIGWYCRDLAKFKNVKEPNQSSFD
ncbi:PREDICTED: uncharacterized protein LOC109484427 [Branchiostoma belcheri]|uniref:Uncharacterized protein LOC109484427 n=1 Tax=Branchiostoma belcheri TaxID=7741 RepID=A0A6P5AAK2_BRABE|nr:PREDICTED: uncharacterized protein LOC109484427 [Branchiostoma belcheri]